MLSFGLILDNNITVPKGMTDDEFAQKFKHTLYNYFFTKVEEGCTTFYTTYQNFYTCLAIRAIDNIKKVTGVDIQVIIIYDNLKTFSTSTEECDLDNCFLKNNTTQLVLNESNHNNSSALIDTSYDRFNTSQEIAKFNILMKIVTECSTIIFYTNSNVTQENNQVHSIYNYCETYSINNINIFDKVCL